MASLKQFPTLIQLERGEGTVFQELSNLTKRPYWFHSEYLKSPKAVHLEAWLVEAIFGPGGENIPHVEWVSQTLLHVNRWEPEGEAEILIFGRPYHQKDVSAMIMNLADYHRQLRTQSSEKASVQEDQTQHSQDVSQVARKATSEAATQVARKATREVATQVARKATCEAAIQVAPKAAREAATQRSPDAGSSPDATREAATQRSPETAQDWVIRL